MSATRTNEKLENLPNSISVMTQEFIQDLAFNDYFDAIEFGSNTENIFNAQGTVGAPTSDLVGSRSGNQVSIRGLVSVRQLRDGFPWYLGTDVYNTERLEMSRGPGGLAYGDVDAGGIINIVSKRAGFQRRASAQVRYDNFGTKRHSLDINQPIVEGRLAARINVINSDVQQWKERKGRELEGYAGALRWEPFRHRRTQVDAMFEIGNTTTHLSHLQLNDARIAYVRGTGTNAVDANATAAGVQMNGIGMKRVQANGVHAFFDIGGVLYNLESTANIAYRQSFVLATQAAAVAGGADPQNPNRYGMMPTPESVLPWRQDWGGPDNRHRAKYHAYTIELKHSISERLNLLLAHNGQVDDTVRKQSFSGQGVYGAPGRAVYIDVNPNLPNPNGPGTIPNPNFEQYYVAYAPLLSNDGHDIVNWRGQIVYDAELPWGISQRIVLGGTYRHEDYYADNFSFALTPAEAARRGYTGAAATFSANVVRPVHYFKDGNSDDALAWDVKPGVTQHFRFDARGPNTRLDQSLTSGSVNALGSYFNGKLRSSVGVSRDHWLQSADLGLRHDPITDETHFVAADGSLVPNRGTEHIDAPLAAFADEWSTNQTFGLVWHAVPWVSLTGGYFESSQFSDNYGLDLNGNARAPLNGEGTDYSVRFHLWKNRIEASATYFETTQENLNANVLGAVRNELNPFLTTPFANLTDYRDRTATGMEYQVLANVNRNWTLLAALSRNRTQFTRFFPLLRERLTEAREAAAARGLDPEVALAVTQEYLADQEEVLDPVTRITASLTTRYSFSEGKLKGLSVGAAARYARGRQWAAVSVGGVGILPATTTEDYVIVNPFVTYRRKFGRSTWTLQLNVNNVLDEKGQIGSSYTWPQYTDPRQFISTATVAF